MRNLLFSLLLCLVALLAGCGQDQPDKNSAALPSFVGQNLVIASFADTPQRANSLTNAFRSAPGLEKRDIVWFVVGPKQIVSSLDQARIPPRQRLEKLHTVNGFQTVLIAKNGTLQASQLGGLDIQALLDALEPLPNRQQALTQ